MKKSAMNLKNTVSKTEKGLKHLKLVGVGREYIEGRLAQMQAAKKQPPPQKNSPDANGKGQEKV